MAKEKNKIAPQVEDTSTTDTIFGDLAVIAKPKSPFSWATNLPKLKSVLEDVRKNYSDFKVTDANYEQGNSIRKQCVTTRRMLEASKKDTIDMYVKPAKSAIEVQYEELLSLVAAVEDPLNEQFSVYEKERIAELTDIYTDFAKKIAKELGLDDVVVSLIEMKKSYFNKGAKELEVRADIKAELERIKAEREEAKRNIELIKLECEADKRLDVDMYLKMLEYRSASAIIFDIKNRVKQLKEMVEQATVGDKIIVGEPPKNLGSLIGSAPKKKVKTKEILLSLSYPGTEENDEILKNFLEGNPQFTWQIKAAKKKVPVKK